MNRQYFNRLTRIELKLQKIIKALERTFKKQEKRGFYKRDSDGELVSKKSWLKPYNEKMNHLKSRLTPLTDKKRELYNGAKKASKARSEASRAMLKGVREDPETSLASYLPVIFNMSKKNKGSKNRA